MRQRPQVEVVRVEAVRPPRARALDFGPADLRLDQPNHRRRHAILEIEEALELAVKALGPQMDARLAFD